MAYKQYKISQEDTPNILNNWFGERFTKTANKIPIIKEWNKPGREFDFINEDLIDATSVGLILEPFKYSVLDVDDKESHEMVRRYLQAKQINYVEQKTDRGFHIYFKYTKSLNHGNKIYMLCNLPTDTKNNTEPMILNIKSTKEGEEIKWREWSIWTNEKYEDLDIDNLNTLLSDIPLILLTSKYKFVDYENNQIGEGNRSSPLYKYGQRISDFMNNLKEDGKLDMSRGGLKTQISEIVSDYNKYFVDGHKDIKDLKALFSQFKINVLDDDEIEALERSKRHQKMLENIDKDYLNVGLYNTTYKNNVKDYLYHLEEYLLTNVPKNDKYVKHIEESVSQFNSYHYLRNNYNNSKGWAIITKLQDLINNKELDDKIGTIDYKHIDDLLSTIDKDVLDKISKILEIKETDNKLHIKTNKLLKIMYPNVWTKQSEKNNLNHDNKWDNKLGKNDTLLSQYKLYLDDKNNELTKLGRNKVVEAFEIGGLDVGFSQGRKILRSLEKDVFDLIIYDVDLEKLEKKPDTYPKHIVEKYENLKKYNILTIFE